MNVLLKTKELQSCIIRRISQFYKNDLISPAQARIIDYLIEKNELVYQKDIEKLLDLRRSTISGILHTMEKNGLIVKNNTKEDARTKEIVLTQKAKELHNDINLKFDKLNEEICNNIDEKEIMIFLNILDKMINNIRKE